MVRLAFTVLALGVSALSASVNKVRAEPGMGLYGRADTPQEDQIKAQMSSISPPLASAQAQLKQAKDDIPQTNKDQIKAAEENVKNTFNGLSEDQKSQLKAAREQLKSAKEAAKASTTPTPAP